MIYQIKYLTADILYQILALVSTVQQKTFSLQEYGNFLLDFVPGGKVGLFVLEEKFIKGFVQETAPHP